MRIIIILLIVIINVLFAEVIKIDKIKNSILIKNKKVNAEIFILDENEESVLNESFIILKKIKRNIFLD